MYKRAPVFSASAEIGCSSVPGIPAAFVNYYQFNNSTAMDITVQYHQLLIDMQGSDGNSLLNWWKELPSPWLASGS